MSRRHCRMFRRRIIFRPTATIPATTILDAFTVHFLQKSCQLRSNTSPHLLISINHSSYLSTLNRRSIFTTPCTPHSSLDNRSRSVRIPTLVSLSRCQITSHSPLRPRPFLRGPRSRDDDDDQGCIFFVRLVCMCVLEDSGPDARGTTPNNSNSELGYG